MEKMQKRGTNYCRIFIVTASLLSCEYGFLPVEAQILKSSEDLSVFSLYHHIIFNPLKEGEEIRCI